LPLPEKFPICPIEKSAIGTAPTQKRIFCKDVCDSLLKYQIANPMHNSTRDDNPAVRMINITLFMKGNCGIFFMAYGSNVAAFLITG